MQCSLGPRLLPRLGLRSRAHAAASAAAVRSVRAPTGSTLARGTWGQADRHVQPRANSAARRFVVGRRSFAAQASGDKASEEEKPPEEKLSEQDVQANLEERRRKIEEVKRKQQEKSQKRMEEVRRKVEEQKRRREADEEKASSSDAGSEGDGGATASTDAKAAKDAETAKADAAEAETPLQRVQKELEELTEKSRSKKHELLLALADFENNKKKFSKERETRRRTATANFARRMVGVYHDFEAMEAFKLGENGDKAKLSEACVALQEGVKLTRDLLNSALEKSSVERFHADLGQPIVAARHEVVGSLPGDGSLPKESVAEVTEPGWALDPRSAKPLVLRKAKVKTVGPEAAAE